MNGFAKEMRNASRSVNRELRTGLKQAGKVLEDRAREAALAHSKKVAATVTSRTRNYMVTVSAGLPGEPLARLFELGNLGAPKTRLKFNHPVFARKGSDRKSWTWTSQDRFPFLLLAVEESKPRVLPIMREAIGRSFKETSANE